MEHWTKAEWDAYDRALAEIAISEREAVSPDVTESAEWAEYNYLNPVEQGMYDDDPSPYDGTYSED